ncbi:helix-turn-helix transcriptional regulator [Streptomyces melanogenes]|uniref:Helix-turn-helix domain-containing protein n=1 Tax=Streptomyces melanogenes TaxID=67326 RepID=A0ABZ1XMA7_9ACTN|nr:helix-turn-helix transcriptional regulator [Streptomyces melanogenes]
MATAESEDFAALLRELKDRSGRSYGVLAGKLHVSTSTLHRYCNGDAVPNEYAPIDRLARLCGATREESVELHRRWILADEARRRSRGAAAEAARPVASAGPDSPDSKEAGTAPAPEPEPPLATPEPEPAPEPEVVSVVTGVGAPRRTSRITKRTRLVLIGAAVALAVSAVAVAALSGGSGDDGGGKSSTVADAKETGRTLPKGTPPKSPAPSPDASSASPSGKGSPSARTPSAPAPRKHAPPAADPLAVGVSSYQWDGPCGKFYLLDQKPGSVPKPPAPEESRPWAGLLGGVDGGHLTLQLTATGKTSESVVINAVHVRVVDRGAPLDWTAYSMGSGCGGSVTPGFFDIDLDADRPRAKPVGGTQGEMKVPATDFPYKVSTTDPQVLNLDVHTDAHDVTWYLEIDWSSGDRSGKIPVYDNGKPFHSSAVKGRPAYEYRLDTNVWERLTT